MKQCTGRGERERERERLGCMPQIGSNIYAIGMITALRDYVRLLRAISMLTLSSHHRHHPFSPLLCSARLSLSLFLSSSSSIVRFCFCLFVPISVVLHYVPYKRQIRVIKRLGHAHCSLVVAHATSAFDLLPVLFVSSSVDSSIRCSSVQRDDFLLWWRSREMEIRERIQFLSEIKFFKVQDWN